MIAVDTNILVYAHREDSEFHTAALAALTDLAENNRRWAIPWPCIHGFLAISTHPRIYSPPTPLETACAAIDVWLSTPSCQPIGEGPGYFQELTRLAVAGKIKGPMIHDARIAALCIHHAVKELWSADRDFSRYRSFKIVNPLLISQSRP